MTDQREALHAAGGIRRFGGRIVASHEQRPTETVSVEPKLEGVTLSPAERDRLLAAADMIREILGAR